MDFKTRYSEVLTGQKIEISPEKSKLQLKIEICVKISAKFWLQIGLKILAKNRNFGQKSKLSAKIEILFKNRNFG